MASQNSFFPLMQLLLYASLLLMLLLTSSSENGAHALRARKLKPEFHTLRISSLLPPSSCTPSKSAAKGSTLRVVHRHGPYINKTSRQDKAATEESLDDILSNDQSRVDLIHARVAAMSNKSRGDHEKVSLPANLGLSLHTGNYLVEIGLGTPKSTLSLVFDTGSDLTWTQCQPCEKCYEQDDPIFDPFLSTSYSKIPCRSPECGELYYATGHPHRCWDASCVYETTYADGSYSIGYFSKEKISITPTDDDVFTDFRFGCGQNNSQRFPDRTAGIIGLGRHPVSLASQAAEMYGKDYFSYCLPSTTCSEGHLSFGEIGVDPNSVQFTPFNRWRGTSFYWIDMVAISVGGQQLPISQSVFSHAGTIIDSGTVITRLPPDAYISLRTAFRQLMRQYPRAPHQRGELLDTCYDFSSYDGDVIGIPAISFTFSNDVEIDIDEFGILYAVSRERVCLAFAANQKASHEGILGNTQQKRFEVVYDVARGRLGFAPGACD